MGRLREPASADARLRRDVRLLGRHPRPESSSSRKGRSCSTWRSEIRRPRPRRAGNRTGIPPRRVARSGRRPSTSEREGLVLRAFALYFQLVNLAEQHHRLRRRRQYENERRMPRESSGRRGARLERAGVQRPEIEDAARGSRSSSCSRRIPTEATRRSVLAAHLRLSGFSRSSTTRPLTPARRRRSGRGARRGGDAALADGRGALAASARRGRDPPRALVLRAEPPPGRRARCSPTTAGSCRARRRRFGSAPGSAATWTATPLPGRRRSPRRSTRPATLALTTYASRGARARAGARDLEQARRRRRPSSPPRSPPTSRSFPSTRRSSSDRNSTSRTAESSASPGSGFATGSMATGRATRSASRARVRSRRDRPEPP